MSVNGEKSTGNIPEAAEPAKEMEQQVDTTFGETVDGSQVPAVHTENFPESAVEKPSTLSVADEDAAEEGDGKVMSVIDHLDELRQRLLRALGVFAVAMAICFYYGREIIRI